MNEQDLSKDLQQAIEKVLEDDNVVHTNEKLLSDSIVVETAAEEILENDLVTGEIPVARWRAGRANEESTAKDEEEGNTVFLGKIIPETISPKAMNPEKTKPEMADPDDHTPDTMNPQKHMPEENTEDPADPEMTGLPDQAEALKAASVKRSLKDDINGWFYTFMCMNIPIIGWIYLLRLAFGKKHPEKRSFARAYLIYKLVFFLIGFLILAVLVYAALDVLDELLAYMEML